MSSTSPTFHLPVVPESRDLVALLPEWLPVALPSYLPGRRWYGDKALTITGIEVATAIPVDGLSSAAALALVTVHFPLKVTSSYLIPVMLAERAGNGPAIAAVTAASLSFVLKDGLEDEQYRSWFAKAIARTTSSSILTSDLLENASATLARATSEPNRLLGVEQSNSSIVFGFEMLVKVLRKLQPGIHPDVELTRFLTARTNFSAVPHYLGSLSINAPDGQTYVIAVAQEYVESQGDGWSYLLASLKSAIDAGNRQELNASANRIAAELGAVTAEMHLALSADPWTADVAPETITEADADHWGAAYLALIDRVTAELSDFRAPDNPRIGELVLAFMQLVPGLRNREGGFHRLVGRSKTRVHGDFHLGQTLVTPEEEFVIIDFEGEPMRTIPERRRKTSPLKDVTGMLRSFSYARGTAASWLEESGTILQSDLVAWERTMRQEFLHSYTKTVGAGGGTFLPFAESDLQAALSAWELDKAAYEVIYELNNRPDWLWIPLSSMLKQAEPESPVIF